MLTAGDAKDQFVTAVAASSTAIGVAGTFTGTLDMANGRAPFRPRQPSATKTNYLAGLSSSDGTALWSKSVNLGTGAINAVAGQYSKDYFIVCGSATTQRPPWARPEPPVATMTSWSQPSRPALAPWSGPSSLGGALEQQCTAAALDDNGNAVVAGTFQGALDFGSGALTPAPTGASDSLLWVAKLDGTTGATLAAQAYGTSGMVQPYAIAANVKGTW